MAERTNRTYALKKDGKTVYIGETNDIVRRTKEHIRDGKNFDEVEYDTWPTSKSTSQDRETQQLEDFRDTHKGKNPKYNKTNHG